MYQNLDLFRTATAMARHAGTREAVVARNIANADTPGYRARDIGSFTDSWREGGGLALRTTRAEHLAGSAGPGRARETARQAEAAPNGNTVSLETEMLAAVQAEREHNRALAIWRHGLGVIRTTLGTGR